MNHIGYLSARFLISGKPHDREARVHSASSFALRGNAAGADALAGVCPGNADRQGRSDERAKLTGSRARYSAQGYHRASPLARERPARRMVRTRAPAPRRPIAEPPSGPNRRAADRRRPVVRKRASIRWNARAPTPPASPLNTAPRKGATGPAPAARVRFPWQGPGSPPDDFVRPPPARGRGVSKSGPPRPPPRSRAGR